MSAKEEEEEEEEEEAKWYTYLLSCRINRSLVKENFRGGEEGAMHLPSAFVY